MVGARRWRVRHAKCSLRLAKLQTAAGDIFNPDVFVTCDPQGLRTDQIFLAPTVIVEVLSPNTQA